MRNWNLLCVVDECEGSRMEEVVSGYSHIWNLRGDRCELEEACLPSSLRHASSRPPCNHVRACRPTFTYTILMRHPLPLRRTKLPTPTSRRLLLERSPTVPADTAALPRPAAALGVTPAA